MESAKTSIAEKEGKNTRWMIAIVSGALVAIAIAFIRAFPVVIKFQKIWQGCPYIARLVLSRIHKSQKLAKKAYGPNS